MKVYYYGSPSRVLWRAAARCVKACPWLRWPLTAALLLVWLPVVPICYVMVAVGEVGHAIAGWCGFDSREW